MLHSYCPYCGLAVENHIKLDRRAEVVHCSRVWRDNRALLTQLNTLYGYITKVLILYHINLCNLLLLIKLCGTYLVLRIYVSLNHLLCRDCPLIILICGEHNLYRRCKVDSAAKGRLYGSIVGDHNLNHFKLLYILSIIYNNRNRSVCTVYIAGGLSGDLKCCNLCNNSRIRQVVLYATGCKKCHCSNCQKEYM